MAFASPFIPCLQAPAFSARICNPLKISIRSERKSFPTVKMMSSLSRSTHPVISRTYVTRDNYGAPVLNVSGVSRSSPPLWLLALFTSAVIWLIRRLAILRHLSKRYQRSDLSQDIARFYDERTAAWEQVWGEHLHHGLYDVVNGKRTTGTTAQIRTMSELLRKGDLLNVTLSNSKVLDVGCGIGGSSRFLARHFGEDCRVTGITLSPYQARRAGEINEEKGLEQRVRVEVRNALKTGFPDEHFDVLWSLESAEHMENKHVFLEECARVLKPDGKMVMLAWCIRETTPPLSVAERFSMRRIMEEYCLPRVAPASEYKTELLRVGFRDVEVGDWTERAAPFWGEVVRSAIFNPKGWRALWKTGWPLIRSALAMRHVIAAINQGVFRLVAFSARKPTAQEIEAEAQRAAELCCSVSSLPSE